MSSIWTPALIGELETLWSEGLSARLIGQRLGVSKSAVIGKSQRLGLPRRPPAVVNAKAKERIAPKRPKIPPPPPKRVENGAFSPRTCQFIAGEATADDSCKCGAPVYETEAGRSSDCRVHHEICWRKAQIEHG